MAQQQPVGACPKCGSKHFSFASSQPTPSSEAGLAGLFALRDRICKACGTQYKATMPKWMPYGIIAVGVFLAAVGVILFFAPLTKGPLEFRAWVKYVLLVAAIVLVWAGGQLARKKTP